MATTKKSKVEKLIEEEAKKLAAESEPQDDEFNPQPTAFEARVYDEGRLVDELFASIPKNQGYYLKLYRVLSTNDTEFKMKIDDWQNWSDVELEVNMLVRDQTIKSPKRWGTGKYRISVWREDGIRGPKLKSHDFFVDAEEIDTDVVGPQHGNQNLDQVAELIRMVGNINPASTPQETQKVLSETFREGMSVAATKDANESKSSSDTMIAMMGMMKTMMENNRPAPTEPANPMKMMADMMTVMTSMGLLKTGNADSGSDGIVKSIQQLQALGIYKPPTEENTLGKLGEMRQMIETIQSLSGLTQGDRPSSVETLINALAPKIPEMISDVTGSINKLSEVGNNRRQYAPRDVVALPHPSDPSGYVPNRHPVGVAVAENYTKTPFDNDDIAYTPESEPYLGPAQPAVVPNQTEGGVDEMLVMQLLDELYTLINSKDYSRFDYVKQQISKVVGDNVLTAVLKGQLQKDQIISYLMLIGGARYTEPVFVPKMQDYFDKFIGWAQNLTVPGTEPAQAPDLQRSHPGSEPSPDDFKIVCGKCNSVFYYDNEEDFSKDPDKTCDVTNGPEGAQCGGALKIPGEKGVSDTESHEHPSASA